MWTGRLLLPALRAAASSSLRTCATITVPVEMLRLDGVTRENAQGFVESDGYIAIEAANTTLRTSDEGAHWEELPGFGETHSAMTVFPVTAASDSSSTRVFSTACLLTTREVSRCRQFSRRH